MTDRTPPTEPLDVRMKRYEAVETGRRLDLRLPVYARIDGRTFSSFTAGMEKPFDRGMAEAMIETARRLVERTGARTGFVQSDEISLVFERSSETSGIFFEGKVQKLASVLAGAATAAFGRVFSELGPRYAGYLGREPHFDARVLNLPSREEAANMLIWRQWDAVRNSVLGHARAAFGHAAMMDKDQGRLLAMLAKGGVDHGKIPRIWREGAFVRRVVREVTLGNDPLRRGETAVQGKNGVRQALRTRIEIADAPILRDLANREEFVFDGADPVAREARSDAA